jgi:hypothetical protein
MLIIGQAEFKPGPWGFPKQLLPYRDQILKLVGAPDAYRFASENDLLAALAAPDTAVPYKYKIGNGAVTAGNASINAIFAEIDKKNAKLAREPDKVKYQSLQQDADTLAATAFTDALGNNKSTFVSTKRTYYYQGAYMSGDQFAVGAALTNDTKSRLILFYVNNADELKAAKKLVKFYVVSCKLTAERLLPVAVGNSHTACFTCDRLVSYRVNPEENPKPTLSSALTFLDSVPAGPHLFPVGGATTDVAECVLSIDQKGRFVKDWANVDPNQNSYWKYRIDKFLISKRIDHGASYVILWIRFSGKEGGAHPELDDSWRGLAQIVYGLLDAGKNVIMVGRPRKNSSIVEKMKKHLDILDEENAKVVPRGNLKIWGEYWLTESGELNKKIVGATRAAEYAILLRMVHSDWGCKLVHVGMRSGAMDAAALLGMRTLFFENPDNEQIKRTQKWTRQDNSNPRYQRIPVEELPTWRARVTMHGYEQTDERDKKIRGYTESDLDMILGQVQRALG